MTKRTMIRNLVAVSSLGGAMMTTACDDPVTSNNPEQRDDFQSGNSAAECAQVGTFEFSCKRDFWDSVPQGAGLNETIDCPNQDGDVGLNEIDISDNDGMEFTWTAEVPLSAVIVVAGSNANIYTYGPATGGPEDVESPLNPAGQQADISHATFCWNGEGGTTGDTGETGTGTDETGETGTGTGTGTGETGTGETGTGTGETGTGTGETGTGTGGTGTGTGETGTGETGETGTGTGETGDTGKDDTGETGKDDTGETGKGDDGKDDGKDDDGKGDGDGGPHERPGKNCCVGHGGVGCEVHEIKQCVCALDLDCCSDAWDDICVEMAINDCGAQCEVP